MTKGVSRKSYGQNHKQRTSAHDRGRFEMAGCFDTNRVSLGGVQRDSGDQNRAPMAISRERSDTVAAQPAGCQREASHRSAGPRSGHLNGLRGFAAIAEIAATG